MAAGTRLTVDLRDPELYSSLRHASVDLNKPMNEIIAEALRRFLDQLEDRADLVVLRERRGGKTILWEQLVTEMPELGEPSG